MSSIASLDDLRRCVFFMRLQQINPTTWRRIGEPGIDLKADCANRFLLPQIAETPTTGRRVVEIQLYDPRAVDLERDDLLGDYSDAVVVCESAFRQAFPGHCIVYSISDW